MFTITKVHILSDRICNCYLLIVTLTLFMSSYVQHVRATLKVNLRFLAFTAKYVGKRYYHEKYSVHEYD